MNSHERRELPIAEQFVVLFVEKLIPKIGVFPMRQQRTHRTSAPAPMSRAGTGLPTSGYTLVVDGQAKRDFDLHERALKAARDLKGRFPMLQVKVYDAEKKVSETVRLD